MKNDVKKKALKKMKMKDEGEMEILKILKERKKNLSPEAFKEYEKTIRETHDMEPDETVKRLEKEEAAMRQRMMRRRAGLHNKK